MSSSVRVNDNISPCELSPERSGGGGGGGRRVYVCECETHFVLFLEV